MSDSFDIFSGRPFWDPLESARERSARFAEVDLRPTPGSLVVHAVPPIVRPPKPGADMTREQFAVNEPGEPTTAQNPLVVKARLAMAYYHTELARAINNGDTDGRLKAESALERANRMIERAGGVESQR